MKRLIPIVASVALAGCANYERLRATAPSASTYELCRAAYLHGDSTVRGIAFGELARRSGDCGQYANALANERAANAQDTANTIAIMRALQPPPSQSVTCTTTGFGNMAQTTCR